MNGFLNINKPSGITSYDVIRRLKLIIPGIKLGHLGTLDPMASGVLPIALGSATRLIQYIEDNWKAYEAEMTLGGVSDTQDKTGNIIPVSNEIMAQDRIEKTMSKFVGVIEQIPPMYSAVHYKGKRLYQLAREGREVKVEPRLITVTDLTILEVISTEEVQIVRFRIECSPGTYVRTICHDAGQQLGCGAFLSNLIRTRSGPFILAESANIDELTDYETLVGQTMSMDAPLSNMTMVFLDEVQAWKIKNGQAVAWPGVNDQYYLLYDELRDFLAIAKGEQGHGVLCPKTVFTGGNNKQQWK
ncbi:MAG: tRNA pseudouridine(55) synthase TruB [Syntrophomonadaceae bacterium]|nr:tRNA pseudouridine(55) synthase TruB [Syntrophomonadaceae bacterium]